MARSNVDTKALEETNNNETTINDATAVTNAMEYATLRFRELIELLGGTEWQTENIARGFVSQAEYLMTNKERQITKYDTEVRIAEDNKERGMAMSQTAIEKAQFLLENCEIEKEDLKLYLQSSKNAYLATVGKKYEPLQKKTTPNKVHRTAAMRLADQQAEQLKVNQDAIREKYKGTKGQKKNVPPYV